MKRMVFWIFGLQPAIGFACGEPDTCRAWPDVEPRSIEDAVQLADAAFTTVLVFANVEELSPNEILVSALIRSNEPLWGTIPFDKIELEPGKFPRLFLARSGKGPSPWDNVGFLWSKGVNQIPMAMLSRGQGEQVEILYVEIIRGSDRASKTDILLIKDLESCPENAALRDRLIDVVVDPTSSELLWSFALRKLFRLEMDPTRRFDLVLQPKIQTAPMIESLREPFRRGRLEYAVELLTGQTHAKSEDYYRQLSPQELRVVYEKLLEVFESTSSPYMAEVALKAFSQQRARSAEFSNQEWSQIRARFQAALNNPEHPFHNLPFERDTVAQEEVEKLMREPNPFAP